MNHLAMDVLSGACNLCVVHRGHQGRELEKLDQGVEGVFLVVEEVWRVVLCLQSF